MSSGLIPAHYHLQGDLEVERGALGRGRGEEGDGRRVRLGEGVILGRGREGEKGEEEHLRVSEYQTEKMVSTHVAYSSEVLRVELVEISYWRYGSGFGDYAWYEWETS